MRFAYLAVGAGARRTEKEFSVDDVRGGKLLSSEEAKTADRGSLTRRSEDVSPAPTTGDGTTTRVHACC